MPLIVARVNHRTAPIEDREELSLSASEPAAVLRVLDGGAGPGEAVLLSTCTRTEVYLLDRDDESVAAVRELFSDRLGEDWSKYLYLRHDRDAAAHLFRVAAGLDSMILGEAQIQGQVQDAWERSREASGAALNRLFQYSQLV